MPSMRRREFITLLGGAAVAWPFAARAQQMGMPTIGLLGGGHGLCRRKWTAAFLQGLNEAG